MKEHKKCLGWNAVLVLLIYQVFNYAHIHPLVIFPHLSYGHNIECVCIEDERMKMKWFDFNVILKCYAGKKLLKSHVENKLKNKEKGIFFPNNSLFFILQEIFIVKYPLLFVSSGRLQQKVFDCVLPPHSQILYYANTRDESCTVCSWLHYILQYCYFSLPMLQEYKLDVYLSCPNCKLLGSLCV